ncbi:hypothetical protein PsorP6_012200 [Peronosclerospora sorghi]|uniref:Uncharacterized protein n=1 Tax=Peronosclerospora sorghi TaxID=230839 RepID=A0ACC0WJL4_9STRA|nr:hypothetical protein PsorP6_012200 [Peronosclerospora sorghi]
MVAPWSRLRFHSVKYVVANFLLAIVAVKYEKKSSLFTAPSPPIPKSNGAAKAVLDADTTPRAPIALEQIPLVDRVFDLNLQILLLIRACHEVARVDKSMNNFFSS